VDIGILLEATLLALALAYQMRQHQHARRKAETLARIDPLTGLLNRRAFLDQGKALLSEAHSNQQPLTLIMLDLDHFKDINDRYGHDMGDRCLVATANLLRQESRAADILARWGGEEFLLLLPATGLDEALQLAERLRLSIAAIATDPARPELSLSASLGLADSQQEVHLEAMINTADNRLYQAKQSGRNRVCGPESLVN
jgi:two-component system, sensor histidine kinase LadS